MHFAEKEWNFVELTYLKIKKAVQIIWVKSHKINIMIAKSYTIVELIN